MVKDKSFVFTGGGSGGHSVVAMTIIDYFKAKGVSNISYIGSHEGLEKDLAIKNDLPYYSISTGKLRRYLSVENVIDVFKFLWGTFQCFYLFFTKLKKTDIVFATGGFVSVPAAISGRILGKKVYLHEQTSRLGLANKIISIFANKIFISFESTKKFISKECIVSGYPIRNSLKNKAAKIDTPKPLLFITGGGNGSKFINDLVDSWKEGLLEKYTIYHQVGKKYFKEYKEKETDNYKVFGFINNMEEVLNSSELIISRAGAGIVCEIMYLGRKALFIPLKIAQRNEQYHNAEEVVKKGHGVILTEDEYHCSNLLDKVHKLEALNSVIFESKKDRSAQIIFENL